MLSFYTGGTRSGKSRHGYQRAEELISASGGKVAIFTFGDERIDEEFRARIARHKQERNPHWFNYELDGSLEAFDLALKSVKDEGASLVIECLGTLLGRIMDSELKEYFELSSDEPIPLKTSHHIEEKFDTFLMLLLEFSSKHDLIVISNEVGFAPISVHASTRIFSDILGRANQKIAEHADESFLVVAGKTISL